jgi:hypothetical protein
MAKELYQIITDLPIVQTFQRVVTAVTADLISRVTVLNGMMK